ncbi:MAG: heparinase II/III family protein [Bacteroidales bacterium]|nr:heparinase II/III family protein [Bacteroidales bacterium]
MKLRYLGFRVYFLLITKLGVLKKRFPTNPTKRIFIQKDEWIKSNIPFFEQSGNFKLAPIELQGLKLKVEKIKKSIFLFFSSTEFNLGENYNWITNPDTGFKYDINKHWTEIEDFSANAGDIKFVWEKSRFTFLYDLIRYDYHFKEDQSEFFFKEIESFIDYNPINQGPNYKCSQEISLRILNWTYALFYYKNCSNLSEELFEKIINSIYWQLKHVYGNINFSRIAVRNNHAITETAALYLSYFLFPFIPETKKWSKKGKKWLEQEINYQIYIDGSYLQFSHNYHRVVIQILTWILAINKLHHQNFANKTMRKIEKTLDFLFQHQDDISGCLPNYGNNDGALFFPLNSNNYRDYRPQLQALGILLNKNYYNESYEDLFWFGLNKEDISKKSFGKRENILSFPMGGFYGFRDNNSLTTIKCGAYKDRPSQADGLNIDIWNNGQNILRDPGTYKYNTIKNLINFYTGTIGHNTLNIGKQSQMIKGGRFIWYYWTKKVEANIVESEKEYIFEGKLYGFPQFGKNIFHKRIVRQIKNESTWIIEDSTNYKGNEKVYVHWNLNPKSKFVNISAVDNAGIEVEPNIEKGWFSELYGIKEEIEQLVFLVPLSGVIKTKIEIN